MQFIASVIQIFASVVPNISITPSSLVCIGTQDCPGFRDIKTTMIDLHVQDGRALAAISHLDM